MADITEAFYIQTQGVWPRETYKISPCAQLIDPNLGFVPAENLFRYINNPLCETNDFNTVSYSNASYRFLEENSQYVLDINRNASFTWNASSSRQAYDLGPQFNYFKINPNPDADVQYRYFYSYLLYPSRLFLQPLTVSKDVTGWTLQTSATITAPTFLFFKGSSNKTLGYLDHVDYTLTTPSLSGLPSQSYLNLVFNLSASRSHTDYPIITFSPTYNPGVRPGGVPVLLDQGGGIIRPDSTFVSYDVEYTVDTKIFRLGQTVPFKEPGITPDFNSSFILNQNALNQNIQIFQLLQSREGNVNIPLNDPSLCVLSATLDLSSNYIRYYSKGFVSSTITNTITGVPGTSIGVSYTVDAPTLYYSQETWESTLNSFNIDSSPGNLGVNTPVNNVYDKIISWSTKYPPHYYSYKTSLVAPSSGFNNLSDSHRLSFYPELAITELSTTYAKLSAYITSDHGFLKYDLISNSLSSEMVKFSLATNSDLFNSGVITCKYGPDFSETYDMVNSPWIPAASATEILIDYPHAPYGLMAINLIMSLKSDAGVLDAKTSCYFTLDDGEAFYAKGHPIFLDVKAQEYDYIDVSAAGLSASPGWPTRDLRDSFITWSYLPADLDISIHSIDLSGNVISSIEANEPVLFSDDTSTVRFSNIGFSSLSAVLSSAKYNETTFVEYTCGLLSQLKAHQYIIGPASQLNNLEYTRSIHLTAGIPYNNHTAYIPPGTPLSWSWRYEHEAPSDKIKVFYGKNKTPYSYGQILPAEMVSAIYVEVTPDLGNEARLNSVKLALGNFSTVDFIRNEFEFFVDDFPDRSILNSDFSIVYSNFVNKPSSVALDTAIDQYVLTRPNDGTNVFILSSADTSHVHPETTYVWSVSDNYLGQHEYIYSFAKGNSIRLEVDPNVSYTTITLSALSALAMGNYGASWDSENVFGNPEAPTVLVHSVKTTAHLFTPASAEFYRPLEFIVYPEYAWAESRYLTLLTPQNYQTVCAAPTAYENKISLSQTFYLSANKSFEEYDYYRSTQGEWTSSVQYSFQDTLTSVVGLTNIPYSSALFTGDGLQLRLSAYSFAYPPGHSIYFAKPSSTLADAVMSTYHFEITGTNIPFSTTNSSNRFKGGPHLKPYQTVPSFSYQLNTKSINLDFSRDVTITQHISTYPVENPARPINGEGTVTYILSSDHWSKTIELSAIDGTFKAFTLQIGDPYEVGYVSNSEINHLSFKPIQIQIPYKIPASTFNNYTTAQYSKERDLWSLVTHKDPSSTTVWQTLTASSNSAPPEAYVSTAFALTGQQIFINYSTPNESSKKTITKYITRYDNSDDFKVSLRNQAVSFSYSQAGTYYISYDVYYSDGSRITGTLPHPIIVRDAWTPYLQEDIRTLSEKVLVSPHSLKDIEISPNEWGDVDIFNSSITKLYNNFKYLENNIQSINTDSPTVYHGWLGCNMKERAQGIRWYTQGFGVDYYADDSLAVADGVSYFTKIIDVAENEDYLYVLDNNKIRLFLNNSYKPQEINILNPEDIAQEFISPAGFAIDFDNSSLYIIDPPRNKVVLVQIDQENLEFNIPLSVGGFGVRTDVNKFNSPTDIVLAENSVFVLDYNNFCVKEFTKDLNWIDTYYTDDFLTDQPIAMTSQHSGWVYILTNTYKVYVFADNSTDPILIFNLPELSTYNYTLNKITFDEAGEFLYISTDTKLFKYSAVGTYICELALSISNTILSVRKSTKRSLLIATSKAVVKVQDIVSFFKIGNGLPYNTWSLDQILLTKKDFASDISYNRSLQRMLHNIKTFRNNLNSRFVIVQEQTPTGIITYFALAPISNNQKPIFDVDVENDLVSVGVNELHLPQVLNRELGKLYNCIETIREFLNITDVNLPDLKIETKGISIVCPEDFCWSWKAMSCYHLALPAIRICSINPITYAELKSDFALSYAPSRTWIDAESDCCSEMNINFAAIPRSEPPYIITQPVSGFLIAYQTENGDYKSVDSITFSVSAGGKQPLRYQWLKDGTDIRSANDRTLTSTASGMYKVVVSNLYGSVVSDTVSLELSGIPYDSHFIFSEDYIGLLASDVFGILNSTTPEILDENQNNISSENTIGSLQIKSEEDEGIEWS
jgi:hypothetical protein